MAHPSHRALVTARMAYPGPETFDPHYDCTPVLMHMVDRGILTKRAALLIAWTRGQVEGGWQDTGAWYSADCGAIVLWRGTYWLASAFSKTHGDPSAPPYGAEEAQKWLLSLAEDEDTPNLVTRLWWRCTPRTRALVTLAGIAAAWIVLFVAGVVIVWALVVAAQVFWNGGLL